MRLWIDTEFNETGGPLISMALVDENGREWYSVLPLGQQPTPWVKANVMPILGKAPILRRHAQADLERWLKDYDAIHVIADWPEDIQYFCQFLITGPGDRINTPPLTLEVDRTLDAVSDLPHNALADARANRQAALTGG